MISSFLNRFSLSAISILVFVVFTSGSVFAQEMMGPSLSGVSQEIYEHTISEEAEGKEWWRQLQAKEVDCANLTDEQFGTLGEHFMGQMLGSSHAAMNQMMKSMMGEEAEEQMHIVMGKRMSSCDTSAVYPSGVPGFMPMMSMMSMFAPYFTNGNSTGMGRQIFGEGGDDKMMGNFGAYGYGPSLFSFFGMFIMIIFWVLVIAAIVALIRWLITQGQGAGNSGRALEILKERYAKGEISKEEFEAKKKDLS